MLIGKIQQIWRYPLKSMNGETLNACVAGSLGLPGDRGWALRDEKTKEITNGKNIPLLMQCAARYRDEPANGSIPHIDITLPDGSRLASDQTDVNERLSAVLGKPVSLWPLQDASNKTHYRRIDVSRPEPVQGWCAPVALLLRMPRCLPQLRQILAGTADEPFPDLSQLPWGTPGIPFRWVPT